MTSHRQELTEAERKELERIEYEYRVRVRHWDAETLLVNSPADRARIEAEVAPVRELLRVIDWYKAQLSQPQPTPAREVVTREVVARLLLPKALADLSPENCPNRQRALFDYHWNNCCAKADAILAAYPILTHPSASVRIVTPEERAAFFGYNIRYVEDSVPITVISKGEDM